MKSWAIFKSIYAMQYKDILPVIICNQVDCDTKVTVSAWSTNSMEICLGMLREIKIYHNIHGLYVDTSCEQIWR